MAVCRPFCSFDKDDSQQNQKLDEMDLDDILNRAEQHETVAAQNEGASLGGEGFLEQFANISDVKNDMNWEDIIPIEERQRVEREEDERKASVAAQAERDAMRDERDKALARVAELEGLTSDQQTRISSLEESLGALIV